MSITKNLTQIKDTLPEQVTLVAVSKTKPIDDLKEAYQVGQRIFGENKVQELVDKYSQLPKDIQWHMIGHLQTNKIKYIAPFVSLIHAVDSEKLLKEINKQAAKNERVIDCLLQVYIAEEQTKFGLDKTQLQDILLKSSEYSNVRIVGLMGMATFTDDNTIVFKEFKFLKQLFDMYKLSYQLHTLSMGMSGDYQLAIEAGSTMIRVGSFIFGSR